MNPLNEKLIGHGSEVMAAAVWTILENPISWAAPLATILRDFYGRKDGTERAKDFIKDIEVTTAGQQYDGNQTRQGIRLYLFQTHVKELALEGYYSLEEEEETDNWDTFKGLFLKYY